MGSQTRGRRHREWSSWTDLGMSPDLRSLVARTPFVVEAIPESSRMNADDRLSLDPLGPVEGGNRIVEGSHVADVCPQPTNPDPLDELTQLGAIGYDDELDSQAARGPRLCRAGDGHQRSSSANQARRPLRDVAADDIENQIDFADVFQGVVIEVDELLCAEVESRLTADRKSTRLNSSHSQISYAVFCLKKK